MQNKNKMILGLISLISVNTIFQPLFPNSGPQYFGQFRQDRYANENFFHGKRNGVFVDIGAYDGVTGSNTYFFEKNLGWTGICIEPMPCVYDILKSKRNCVCVQACITDYTGTGTFLEIRDNTFHPHIRQLSGLIEKFGEFEINRLNEITLKRLDPILIRVKCFKLNDLLEQNNIYHVDFLSLDTEGGDLDILKSIDFDKFSIDVITIENNDSSPDIKNFLDSKGYIFIEKVGVDEIYKKLE